MPDRQPPPADAAPPTFALQVTRVMTTHPTQENRPMTTFIQPFDEDRLADAIVAATRKLGRRAEPKLGDNGWPAYTDATGRLSLADDIASSMGFGHEETCQVWWEDADGCSCPILSEVASALHTAGIVEVVVERGYDPATRRGDHLERRSFDPHPLAAVAAQVQADELGAAYVECQRLLIEARADAGVAQLQAKEALRLLDRLFDAASVEEEDWSPQSQDELIAALNEAGEALATPPAPVAAEPQAVDPRDYATHPMQAAAKAAVAAQVQTDEAVRLLRDAAIDVVLQQGRHRIAKFAVVPRAAVNRLAKAVNGLDRHDGEPGREGVR